MTNDAFADLPAAESTLLWAMRVWVIGHCRQQDMSDRIGAGLREMGADDALGFLEGFMWALSRGASRPIEVLCLCRREVSDDEQMLLRAFSCLQEDEAAEAQALLCGLMSEAATTVALRSAEGVAARFEAAGLVMASAIPPGFGRLEGTGALRTLH